LSSEVKKIPLTLDCIDYNFNITEPQPQLFVSKDFEELKDILKEMASSFSYQRGGKYGLNEAVRSKTINTVELDSGLQISGRIVNFFENADKITYVKAEGPSQLSFEEIELEGHNNKYHQHGYSTITERPTAASKALHLMSAEELKNLGISEGGEANIDFASGLKLTGLVKEITLVANKPIIIAFENCSIKKGEEVLFAPDWGTFDWGLGEEVVSVFSGPADFAAFGDFENFHAIINKTRNFSADDLKAHAFYQNIREVRESYKKSSDVAQLAQALEALYTDSIEKFGAEWLAKMELYELFLQIDGADEQLARLKSDLEAVGKSEEHLAMHIHDSFAIANTI